MNAQETVNYLLQLPRESEYFSNDDTGANLIATKLYHNDIGMDMVREHMMPPLFGNVIYLEGGLK